MLGVHSDDVLSYLAVRGGSLEGTQGKVEGRLKQVSLPEAPQT